LRSAAVACLLAACAWGQTPYHFDANLWPLSGNTNAVSWYTNTIWLNLYSNTVGHCWAVGTNNVALPEIVSPWTFSRIVGTSIQTTNLTMTNFFGYYSNGWMQGTWRLTESEAAQLDAKILELIPWHIQTNYGADYKFKFDGWFSSGAADFPMGTRLDFFDDYGIGHTRNSFQDFDDWRSGKRHYSNAPPNDARGRATNGIAPWTMRSAGRPFSAPVLRAYRATNGWQYTTYPWSDLLIAEYPTPKGMILDATNWFPVAYVRTRSTNAIAINLSSVGGGEYVWTNNALYQFSSFAVELTAGAQELTRCVLSFADESMSIAGGYTGDVLWIQFTNAPAVYTYEDGTAWDAWLVKEALDERYTVLKNLRVTKCSWAWHDSYVREIEPVTSTNGAAAWYYAQDNSAPPPNDPPLDWVWWIDFDENCNGGLPWNVVDFEAADWQSAVTNALPDQAPFWWYSWSDHLSMREQAEYLWDPSNMVYNTTAWRTDEVATVTMAASNASSRVKAIGLWTEVEHSPQLYSTFSSDWLNGTTNTLHRLEYLEAWFTLAEIPFAYRFDLGTNLAAFTVEGECEEFENWYRTNLPCCDVAGWLEVTWTDTYVVVSATEGVAFAYDTTTNLVDHGECVEYDPTWTYQTTNLTVELRYHPPVTNTYYVTGVTSVWTNACGQVDWEPVEYVNLGAWPTSFWTAASSTNAWADGHVSWDVDPDFCEAHWTNWITSNTVVWVWTNEVIRHTLNDMDCASEGSNVTYNAQQWSDGAGSGLIGPPRVETIVEWNW